MRISHTIVDEVVNKKQAILSVDTLSDRHFGAQESIIAQAIRSVMCVPLLLEGECLGLIQVDTSSDPYAFKEQDLEMLTGVCAEAAVALKNFQLYSDIERLLDGFVRASVQAIEERDPVTAGHSFRVAAYAEQFAVAVDRADSPELRQILFSKDQLREIRYAALLHDFGKVGVREHVLRKEKKLHHADMRMLEQRFRHARACLERQAWRRLTELHLERDLSMAAFRAEKERIEQELLQESARLDGFLEAIRRANEPAVSVTEAAGELRELLGQSYPEDDGRAYSLAGRGGIPRAQHHQGLPDRRRTQADRGTRGRFLFLPDPDPLDPRPGRRAGDRPWPPRKAGWLRLSDGPARRADLRADQDAHHLRHLRRAHRTRPALQEIGAGGAGARPDVARMPGRAPRFPPVQRVCRIQSMGGRMKTLLSAVTCAVLLGACADVSMPAYRQPDTPVKAGWSQSQAANATVSAPAAIAPDWWKEFRDPTLDELVAKAISGNFDVKVLAERINVAGAQIGEARAGALPTLEAGAGASFEKSTGQEFTKQFNLGTQVNWEIDIWGKVAKGVQAQTAEYRATEADWRAGYLSLVSDVSTTYFQILQFDEQIAQQRVTLEKNRQILSTFEAMLQNGLIPQTRVLQQRAEINRLTNDQLELDRLRKLAGNALSTLLGVPAGDFILPTGQLQKTVQLPQVPAGLPSELLKRRPDIVAAEYRVLSAYDLVGQAKLAQLPSVSLTARGGSASFELGSLLKSFTFGLLPSINFPIFDPSVQARIKTSEAETKLIEQEYRRTVMAAFEEVENALVNLDSHKKQRVELQQQVDSLSVVATQIQAQLKEGLVSQLELFETERSLLGAQLALLANHQQLLSDTVTLYKALGGGWPTVDVANAGADK